MPSCDKDYLALRSDAEVIEADGHGEKVLRLPDGSYLKVFRRKRLLTSAVWAPYARRFADNAAALSRLGIAAPDVVRVYRFPIIRCDVVHYRPLPGDTLRQLIGSRRAGADTRALLGGFVASLHRLGVYFRSIHLGNVVLDEAGRFGLIDIADMKIHRHALSRWKRKRNFAHLMRYRMDQAWLLDDDGRAFIEGYVGQAEARYSAQDLRSWFAAAARAGR